MTLQDTGSHVHGAKPNRNSLARHRATRLGEWLSVRQQPGDDHQHYQRDEHQGHVGPGHAAYPDVPSACRARRISAIPLPSMASSSTAVR